MADSGQAADRNTIFALSTAAGRAGIAVLRVSGPGAGAALKRLTRWDELPAPRCLVRAPLRAPGDHGLLDRGLVAWFPGPGSATGEDLAELHLHGGPAVVAAVMAALSEVPGLRLAEPGEFTRRGFEAGKLDLAEVEGLADLVAAETEAQRRQALALADGALSQAVADWRAVLLGALAHLEAAIDFPDEALPDGIAGSVAARVAALRREMAGIIAAGRRGERIRAGICLAIVGPPNAGKSSLLNRLAQREAAIVAETAGTTRDVVEVQLDLGGYPVTLADTAGLWDSGENGRVSLDKIEREGMRRARARAMVADLVLILVEVGDTLNNVIELREIAADRGVLVVNKIDTSPDIDKESGRACTTADQVDGPVYYISAKTGAGVDRLTAALRDEVARRFAVSQDAPVVARLRQREALSDCAAALGRFAEAGLPELAAEDLRLALRALDRLLGRSDVEDVLDVIFRDFCIGK